MRLPLRRQYKQLPRLHFENTRKSTEVSGTQGSTRGSAAVDYLNTEAYYAKKARKEKEVISIYGSSPDQRKGSRMRMRSKQRCIEVIDEPSEEAGEEIEVENARVVPSKRDSGFGTLMDRRPHKKKRDPSRLAEDGTEYKSVELKKDGDMNMNKRFKALMEFSLVREFDSLDSKVRNIGKQKKSNKKKQKVQFTLPEI